MSPTHLQFKPFCLPEAANQKKVRLNEGGRELYFEWTEELHQGPPL